MNRYTAVHIFIFLLVTLSSSTLFSTIPENYFQGKYTLKQSALNAYIAFDNGDPKKFGTFTIQVDDKQQIVIPDIIYPVGKDLLGTRVIPVSDNGPAGSKIMDQHLRQLMYGDPESSKDIFSIIVYNHPEKHFSAFNRMTEELRTEMGMTHAGTYIGEGRTRNAPVNYHNQTWEVYDDSVHGYPAHVYTVSLRGEKQEVVNQNILTTLRILNGHNDGPEFPKDYKFDYFRTINLKENLDFYRAWIDPEFIRNDINTALGVDPQTPYIKLLKTHPGFMTYCNEHITIALNVALNLVQTPEGYKDVWGEQLGGELFKKANKIFSEVTKKEAIAHATKYKLIPEDQIASIIGQNIKTNITRKFKTPLWKRRLLNPTLPLIDDLQTTVFAQSLAWRPQTTADVIGDFVDMYANFTKVTAVRSSFVIMEFAGEVLRRMGIAPKQYLQLSLKFIKRMLKHDLRLNATKYNMHQLPKGHLHRKIFTKKYMSAIRKGFELLTNGIPKMEALNRKQQKVIDKLLTQIDELKVKLAKKEDKTLQAQLKKKLLRKEHLKLQTAASIGKISIIPDLLKILDNVEAAAPNLIDNPTLPSSIKVSRETIKKLKLDLPEDMNTLTLEKVAWISFLIDINKKNIHTQKNGKSFDVSLMDIARDQRPETAFIGQFKNSTKYVQYYSAPALIHKIALGLYRDRDPDLVITTVATAFGIQETEENNNYDESSDNIFDIEAMILDLQAQTPTITNELLFSP